MFFTLAKSKDNRLPNHVILGSWWFSYDNGWVHNAENGTWTKGYNQDSIDHGNYTQLYYEANGTIRITHDKYRGYPLWWNESSERLTNFLGTGQKIYSDERVHLRKDGIEIFKQDVIESVPDSTLEFDTVLSRVAENLIAKASHLREYLGNPKLPKKLFVSGGIDTVTLHSLAEAMTLSYDLVDYEHFEYDAFTNQNMEALKKAHWGYTQIHHWKFTTLFMTGACGDEFLMRGPNTASMWAAWHDINIMELLEKDKTSYHYHYYNKPGNAQVFKSAWEQREQLREKYPTKQDLNRQILNINANDYQHWHLGYTITWTPFKDLELTKLMLQLPEEKLVGQILDADFSKHLIEGFNPESMRLLSRFKNRNVRENMHLL